MSKMRETDGYMTVEVSLIFPIAFLIFLLFIEYAVYFMNCGIVQGVMEEFSLKAADTVVTGGSCKDGRISYGTLNQRNLYLHMLPGKAEAAGIIEKEIKNELSGHLFLGKAETVKVNVSAEKIKTQVKMKVTLPGIRWMDLFGIRMFEYQGEYQTFYLLEIEKARRWSTIERSMD